MAVNRFRGIVEHQAPDEGRGGAADASRIKVGDKEYTLEEARQRLENVGAQVRAADERNTQNRRDLEEIERRREDLRQQEERLGSLHDRTLASLDQVLANGRQSNEPAGPVRISARDALSRVVADVDTMSLNEDEDAPKRLKERLLGIGDVIEQQMGQQETQFEQRLQEELTKRDQTWETRVAQVESSLTSRLSQRDQQAAIDERNDKVFSDYVGQKYPTLTREEREEAYRLYKQKLGENYGQLDRQAGRFLYNDKAAEDAVRGSRAWDRLQEEKFTQIRLDERRTLLESMELGQMAGESTPGLSRPAVRIEGDDAFIQKVSMINDGVKSGRISPVQASEMLSLDEKKKIREYQQRASVGQGAG